MEENKKINEEPSLLTSLPGGKRGIGKLRVALLHDFLLYPGGAERVLRVLSEMFPEAPIYTLLYNEEKMVGMFAGRDIRPSYLQKFPQFLKNHHQWLIPFFPVVPETFDLREYDLVISSSGAWMKGIVTKMSTTHIAYLHSPMRFVWDMNDRYVKEIKQKRLSFLARFFFSYLRIWDRLAGDRPDYLIANSSYTQKRIEKYYRREAVVIYPPVSMEHGTYSAQQKIQDTRYNNQTNLNSQISNDQKNSSLNKTEKLMPKKLESYFLVVSRLSPYKKVDVVVEAFNKLGLPLVVIGQGQQERYLRKIAKDNVQILGWQTDEVTRQYYEKARGFIFSAEDDFGITVVEAMNFGVPVIAYRKGGALETVQEGITGEFFDAQAPEVLADGVRRFLDNEKEYDKQLIQKRGGEFSKERFEKEIREFIEKVLEK
jgi:glycosyltransferase involved in cell wall biosynthesis